MFLPKEHVIMFHLLLFKNYLPPFNFCPTLLLEIMICTNLNLHLLRMILHICQLFQNVIEEYHHFLIIRALLWGRPIVISLSVHSSSIQLTITIFFRSISSLLSTLAHCLPSECLLIKGYAVILSKHIHPLLSLFWLIFNIHKFLCKKCSVTLNPENWFTGP